MSSEHHYYPQQQQPRAPVSEGAHPRYPGDEAYTGGNFSQSVQGLARSGMSSRRRISSGDRRGGNRQQVVVGGLNDLQGHYPGDPLAATPTDPYPAGHLGQERPTYPGGHPSPHAYRTGVAPTTHSPLLPASYLPDGGPYAPAHRVPSSERFAVHKPVSPGATQNTGLARRSAEPPLIRPNPSYSPAHEGEAPSPPMMYASASSPVVARRSREASLFVQYRLRVKKVRPVGFASVDELTAWLTEIYRDAFGDTETAGGDYIPYVCQPQSTVFYEVEDVAEVVPGCTLRFNLDDVPAAPTVPTRSDSTAEGVQVIGEGTKEVLELLKSLVLAQSERHESLLTRIDAVPAAVSINPTNARSARGSPVKPISAQTAQDLGSQLRTAQQELRLLRQTYRDQQEQTEALIRTMKAEYVVLREGLTRQPKAMRALIENGKAKLGKSTDDIAARNDELRTLIDTIRQDLTQRRSRPSPSIMAFIERECAAVSRELQEHLRFVEDVKPVWKNAWEDELQNIMSEQLFVKDQQSLLEDLQHESEVMNKFYTQLKQYASIRDTSDLADDDGGANGGGGGSRGIPRVFDVAPAEDGPMILQDVFQEISCISVNSQKRLEALERAQKVRQRELASKTDEFADELAGFVQAQRLRKTGGTEELERQRQKKDREVLRMMNETQQQLLDYQREQRLLRQTQKAEQQRRALLRQQALAAANSANLASAAEPPAGAEAAEPKQDGEREGHENDQATTKGDDTEPATP
ncbi:Bud site selection protein 6 [Tieghemiomyces parasiticus]|uniref:Bud site selection protein 6 n=1 Tax=Tieghemiomyces parasiticus TaxID=78921 RepID=A0A9W8ADT7_9FUNG|nr:Bud site selection protein 6 [Tieghemiomyces parasiticus]